MSATGVHRTYSARWAALGLVVLVTLSAGTPSAARERTDPAEDGSSDWRQVSTGGDHTCGIRTTGRLYCWGRDDAGQLGDGGGTVDQREPVEVVGGETDWVTVSAGARHTCARRSTGRLYCWGRDAEGQLGDGGDGTDPIETLPVQVAGGAATWTQISAGGFHTCARRSTGRLYCWGEDFYGQVGDGGADDNRFTPTPVAGSIADWASVSAGFSQTCAIRRTGRLYCWGDDTLGQLGNGLPAVNVAAPVTVGSATDWTSVSAGGEHTCGRRRTGRLYCWGSDTYGAIGDDGTFTNRFAPRQVAGALTSWTGIATGLRFTCARRTTGRLYCWGYGFKGELGNDDPNTDHRTPVPVAGGATDWTSFAAGAFHACALIRTGRLYCWGNNFSGQLGNEAPNDQQWRPYEVFAP